MYKNPYRTAVGETSSPNIKRKYALISNIPHYHDKHVYPKLYLWKYQNLCILVLNVDNNLLYNVKEIQAKSKRSWTKIKFKTYIIYLHVEMRLSTCTTNMWAARFTVSMRMRMKKQYLYYRNHLQSLVAATIRMYVYNTSFQELIVIRKPSFNFSEIWNWLKHMACRFLCEKMIMWSWFENFIISKQLFVDWGSIRLLFLPYSSYATFV